jgi:hypothetical protein
VLDLSTDTDYLTVAAVARMLGVTPRKARRIMREAGAVQVSPRCLRVHVLALSAWLSKQSTGVAP